MHFVRFSKSLVLACQRAKREWIVGFIRPEHGGEACYNGEISSRAGRSKVMGLLLYCACICCAVHLLGFFEKRGFVCRRAKEIR